eukprot:jgi/Picsp_1/1552/NSC_05030-R1_protein
MERTGLLTRGSGCVHGSSGPGSSRKNVRSTRPQARRTLVESSIIVTIKCNNSFLGAEKRKGRSQVRCEAGLGDSLRDLFDFEKWAPRSSQAWRLGNDVRASDAAAKKQDGKMTDDDVDVLNERLAASRSMDSDGSGKRDGRGQQQSENEGEEDSAKPSFLQSTDEEFAEALNEKITQVASTYKGRSSEDGVSEDTMYVESCDSNRTEQLTGAELLELIYAKYGKKHDVAFVRRDIPGKTLVSLNLYHAYLGQRSFPMSAEDYEEKLDGVACYLEFWGQTDRVISFLKEPITPRRGLPSRPIVGNAVSISLDLTPDQIAEWFGR